MNLIRLALSVILSLTTLGFLFFALTSWRESHRRAFWLGVLFSILSALTLVFLLLLPHTIQVIAITLIAAVILFLIGGFFLPIGKTPPASPMPTHRVDERTTIFARARLQPGTPAFVDYYAAHPEHLISDNTFRTQPGLLAPHSTFFDDLLVSSPVGSFFFTEALRCAVDGAVRETAVERSPELFSAFVRSLAIYHGAKDVGICWLQPYHIYSHIGRGTGDYGAPITLDHQFGIAITVEMAHGMVNTAPRLPTVMESARQYEESARIAVVLAAAIRALGYPARAHIDGNYRVIAPLVARDAGLGDIGRMGLLMTPRLGPRVRLAVVTTDLPLLPDDPAEDPSMLDFCLHCHKCADVCPSQAIPYGERQTYEDSTLRWKIDAERCYTYWTRIGTDCGRCMAVCPYAHADQILHNLIRSGVKRSGAFRRGAKRLDDFFYGKKPHSHQAPPWLDDFN